MISELNERKLKIQAEQIENQKNPERIVVQREKSYKI